MQEVWLGPGPGYISGKLFSTTDDHPHYNSYLMRYSNI